MENKARSAVVGRHGGRELLKTVGFILSAFAVILLVCFLYNIYFVDNCLADLELSLHHARKAADISDLKPVSAMLDSALNSELSRKDLSADTVSYISLCRDMIKSKPEQLSAESSRGDSFTPVNGLLLGLSEAVNAKKRSRGWPLSFLDGFSGGMNNLSTGWTVWVNRLFGMKKGESCSGLLDSAQAKFRSGDFDGARSSAEEVIKLSVYAVEIDAARSLIARISGMKGLDGDIGELKKKAEGSKDAVEKQKILFDLGLLESRRMNFDAAEKAFKDCASLNPSSQETLKAQFGLGWVYKLSDKKEESLKAFRQVTVLRPSSDLFKVSLFEIADIFRSQGLVNKSVSLLNSLSEKAKNTSLGRMSLLKVAEITASDLKNGSSANAIFKEASGDFFHSARGRKLNIIYLAVSILVLLLVLLIMSFRWFRSRKNVKPPVHSASEPLLSPREKAFRRLTEIKKSGLLQEGRIQDIYCQVSECIKVYAERSFGINAAEMTTEEFVSFLLNDKRLNGETKTELGSFFQDCDRVKFAKYRPSDKEIEAVFQKAYKLLGQIR